MRENEKITVVCLHSPENLEFGQFTLLFCRDDKELYRNVSLPLLSSLLKFPHCEIETCAKN